MKIEIFSTPRCGFCDQAKRLLDAKGIDYTDYDISADEAYLDEFRRRLPRVKAIPQIFVEGEHIGSYEDLYHLDASGRLDKLLNLGS